VEEGAGKPVNALARALSMRRSVMVRFKSLTADSDSFGAPVMGAVFDASLTMFGREVWDFLSEPTQVENKSRWRFGSWGS